MNHKAIAVFFCLTAFIASVHAESSFDLAEISRIVIPEKATVTEKFAANELAKYLRGMCGKKLSVTTIPKPGPTVFIGGTTDGAKAKNQHLRGKDLEAFYMGLTPDHNLVLVGNCDRATLYAVYGFLEKLGCLWPAPGFDYVPEKTRLTMKSFTEVQVPGFKYRYIRFIPPKIRNEWDKLAIDWAVKQRINMVHNGSRDNPFAPKFPKMLMERGGVRGIGSVHSAGMALNEEIFRKNPEWLAEISGSRRFFSKANKWGVNRTQPCTSAPGIADFYAEKIIKVFKEHPGIEVFPLTPADGSPFCQCEKCRSLDSGREWLKNYPVVTERWLTFVNQVAEKVAKACPGKKIYTTAYQQTMLPPAANGIEPVKNVIVQVVHGGSRKYPLKCIYHHYDGCDKNRNFMKVVNQWVKITPAGVWVYDYYPHSLFYQMPYIAIDKVIADLKILYKTGCDGFEAQSSSRLLGTYLFDLYAMCQTMWNPKANRQVAMDKFFRAMYGPAAPEMEKFAAYLETAMNNRQEHPGGSLMSYLTPEVMNHAEKLLDQALAKAGTNSVKDRILALKDHFYYTRQIMTGLDSFYHRKSGADSLRKAIACFELLDTYRRRIWKASPERINYGVWFTKSMARVSYYYRTAQKQLKAMTARPVVPNKPGARIGIYTAGCGADDLLKTLSEISGINAFIIPNLRPGTLKYCEIVILPNTGKSSAIFNASIPILRRWVSQGGRLVLMHDAVGFRQHKPAFPEIGKGIGKNSGKDIIPASGEKFQHAYLDHIQLEKGAQGKIFAKDVAGKPVAISGHLGKGRVLLTGTLIYVPADSFDVNCFPPGKAEKEFLQEFIKALNR